ncbi:R3H domain-containing protein 1 [Mortierella sp. AM989]|nr:R3H domain-containing protein 1 [Mortierella sp. AM989]
MKYPSTADDAATSLPKNEEQTPDTPRKAAFTILKPDADSTPNILAESATGHQLGESSASNEQVSSLTNSLEGLQVEDEVTDMEDTGLDEFLVNALKNRQDRIFLLKLDREFCSFLNNPSKEQLEFPSLNSYYRMVVHRVANYFKITRVVDPQQKRIVLFKTEKSAIPALRFSHLVEEEEEQPVKPMKLLKRNPNRPANDSSAPDGSSEPDRKTISIKEREEAYAKARARIFKDDVPAKSKSESTGLDQRSDSPSAPTPTTEVPRPDSAEESAKQKGRKQGNGRKPGSGSVRSPDELGDSDYRQQNQSSPSSRNVSRSTSPSPSAISTSSDSTLRGASKGLGPKTKQSKTDLAAECAESRRRRSTTSNASGTVGTPVGLARTISSSSSQDGFQSPGLGTTLTESPAVNSPSNSTSKVHDYFGQNPTSTSGSVSPMSSGSSRTSFTYPQSNTSKQHRNTHGGGSSSSVGGGGNHGSGLNNSNYGSQTSNPNFIKGMNPSVFVPKKPYSKHNNNFAGGGNNFNNGPTAPYPSGLSGPPGHGLPFNNNGTNGPYTHPQLGPSSPWHERGVLSGHDPSSFYNAPQDPSAFPYGNPQYPQSSIHPPFSNPTHSHANNHHQQHIYHSPSHRGGRRNPTSKPHIGHQPHYQHPHHARTHPQMHPTPYHNNNNSNSNYNTPSVRDDFGYPQGSQSAQRYGRPFDGNPGQVPPQQFTADMYQAHGMPGEAQSVPNIYSGFGQPLTTPPGENSINGPRYLHNQKASYDQNWNQGQNQEIDPNAMLYNPMSQPVIIGKKAYSNYQPNTPMNQQAMGSQPQNNMTGQPSLMMGGPGGVGGGGGGGGGGHTMYDIERRPPKSVELFDPNGPSNNGGGQGEYSGVIRQHGFNEGTSAGQDSIQVTGERLYQGTNFHPSPSHHGPQYSSNNYPPQHSHHAHSHPHQYQHHNQQQQQQHSHQQQPPHQTYTSVVMNRSFSSSSSTGHSGGNSSGNNSTPAKKNSLLYDYSAHGTATYDGVVKSSPLDSEGSSNVPHILEIYDFDPEDDILKDLVVPTVPKLIPMKSTRYLAVFKNATVASEALVAFQEGKETWMAPDAKLRFESSESSSSTVQQKENESEEGGEGSSGRTSMQLQRRFNVRLFTPTMVNRTNPIIAGGGNASPVKGQTTLASPSCDANGSNDDAVDIISNNDESPAQSAESEAYPEV